MADTSTALQPIDLQLLFNAIPGAFVALDAGLIIRQVSDAFLVITAAERQALVGQPFLTAFAQPTAEGAPGLHYTLLAAAHTLATHRCGQAQANKEGQEGYREWLVTPVPAADGRLAAILLQVNDVTGQQPQEPRGQQLLQALQQNLNDVVWDWDLATNDIWWSNGLNTSFGYPPQETAGTAGSWYSRIHPDDAVRVITGTHQVIDSDLTLWSEMYRFKKKNGEYAQVLARGSVLRDAMGNAYRMIGTLVDISVHQTPAAERPQENLALVR
jgi:PAS domain S-box-containing protein